MSDAPAPWGFRLLVGAATAYLLVRLIEGAAWLWGRMFQGP